MDKLINQMLEEINKKATEKQKKDKEYLDMIMGLINNITGTYTSKTNVNDKPSTIYASLFTASKRGIIDVKINFSAVEDMYDTESAIRLVIRREKEKEFLEWLTKKALPAFVIGEHVDSFNYNY